jgi:hypothetical protein
MNSENWNEIAKKVSSIALTIFPHIRGKKLKSEIISNLFESKSGEYFNSIGIETKVAESDRDADLLFNSTTPCEIKVTGVNSDSVKKARWMGGKYSKRTSDYIFVMWNFQEEMETVFGREREKLSFFIVKCFVSENEWKTIDSGKENYYATAFDSEQIFEKKNEIFLGGYESRKFILKEPT